MQKIKTFFAYFLAVLSFPLILAAFIGNTTFAKTLMDVTQAKINPWITGGDIVQAIPLEYYKTLVHEPVFKRLFWESQTGFIQVEWTPIATLPNQIDQEIDIDQDGKADFRVNLNPKTLAATVIDLSGKVIDLEGVYRLDQSIAIRVNLRQ